MLILKEIDSSGIESLLSIAEESFCDDSFYSRLSANMADRKAKIRLIFKRSLEIAVRFGVVLAHFEDGRPVSFASWVDYHSLKEKYPDGHRFIFPSNDNASGKDAESFASSEYPVIKKLTEKSPLCLYLVAIATLSKYRRKGLATQLVTNIINAYPNYTLCSDISNSQSLPLYLNNGFKIFKSDNEITYILHPSPDTETAFEKDQIYLAVPEDSILRSSILKNIPFETYHFEWAIPSSNGIAFTASPTGTGCDIEIYSISYHTLIKYQGLLNLLHFDEAVVQIDGKSVLFYYMEDNSPEDSGDICDETPSFGKSNLNLVSPNEYALSNDLIILIPITYSTISFITERRNINQSNSYMRKLLQALEFRTCYESGDPSLEYDNFGFKSRIVRFFLTNVKIQLQTETTISFNQPTTVEPIDSPITASISISVDRLSDSGVIIIAIPSCRLPVSQVLDSMSRNQLMIIDSNSHATISLLEHLRTQYHIFKSGSAKAFLTVFDDKSNISDAYLGSLLFSETFYENNTGLGKVVDKKIESLINSEFGIAQYNYASVFCYKNMVMQMTSRFRTSVNERIIQESITLFYIELILFEESAIVSVEQNISSFLNKLDRHNNSTVLSNINTILSNYAKSSDFWDISMNYPSSRRSVEELRNAFQIAKLRNDVSNKKDTLLNICTIRDTILDETEGYFISIIGIIVAAFSCADLINSNHLRQIIGFVLILIFLFLALRFRMNRKIRVNKLRNIR